jgi:membrane protein
MTPPPGKTPDNQTRTHKFVQVCRFGWRQLLHDRAPQMAAALAYRTLFSLIPVLVLSLVIVGAFAGEEGIKRGLEQLMDYGGLDEFELAGPVQSEELAVEQGGEPGEPVAASEGAVPADGSVQDQLETIRLTEWIESFIENATTRVTGINFGGIAVVGAAVFIYGALSLLIQIESAFNVICRASRGRRMTTRVTTYWSLLTLGALALGVSFSLGQGFRRLLDSLPTWAEWATLPIQLGAKVGVTWLLFLFAYRHVPNTRIELRAAAIGALIAAVLWELCKGSLAWFISESVGAQFAVYGPIAILPLFLLWVYVTWLIILFGLEVTHALQVSRRGDLRMSLHSNRMTLIDPGMAVVLARAVAERFGEGDGVDLDELAERSGLEVDDAIRIAERLVERGLFHRVIREDESEMYALARSSEQVTVADVIDAMAAPTASGHEPRDADALRVIRENLRASSAALTLESLIEAPKGKDRT